MRIIKILVIYSVFQMVGFLLISIGTTISSIYADFELFMEAHHFKPAQLVVAIGIIIFFVSLFGCIGAVKESTCLVNLFGFLLSVLLVLEISAAIAAYVMRSNIEAAIEENMQDALKDYETERDAWDFMQGRLACCGVQDCFDWEKVNITNGIIPSGLNRNLTVPNSCCKFFECTEKKINTNGCLERLNMIASESALMLGVGATCVAFVQLLGVVFAFMLSKTIRKVKTEEELRRQENRQKIYEQLVLGNDEKVSFGIALIAIGQSMLLLYNHIETFLKGNYINPVIFMMVLGGIFILISAFGFIGIIKNSTMFVNINVLLLCAVFILEVSATIAVTVKHNDILNTVETSMYESMGLYSKSKEPTESWDFIQEYWKCCGVHKKLDWKTYEISGVTITAENITFNVPESCCTSLCKATYDQGCLDFSLLMLSQQSIHFTTVSVCIAVVQIIGIVLAKMVANNIRKVKSIEEMLKQHKNKLYDQIVNERNVYI
ncbi:hypothetical protein FQA39_LY01149 [Lamprigera yunnana]|nr:hypothetical protein FQA39_LY01149 [Lamprigera yunnana]